jgi:hypothetical protein
MFILESNWANFKSLTASFIIDCFLYGISGFIAYGFFPLLFEKCRLTNEEYNRRKKEKLFKEEEMKEEAKESPSKNEGYPLLHQPDIKPNKYQEFGDQPFGSIIENDDEKYIST